MPSPCKAPLLATSEHDRHTLCKGVLLCKPPKDAKSAAGCQKLSDLHLLRHMSSLRELDLSQTDTDDRGVFRIAAMPHLSRLQLRDTAVTASALRGLADLEGLQSLDISHTSVHQGLRHLGPPGSFHAS